MDCGVLLDPVVIDVRGQRFPAGGIGRGQPMNVLTCNGVFPAKPQRSLSCPVPPEVASSE